MNLEVVVFESLGLRVDTAAYRAELDGVPLALEPKAFDLLVFLLSNAGQLVTKQQILDTVWRGTAVSDNALTRVIAQLRKAIGDDAREAKYLETVPTRGYRWIAPVTRGSDRVRTRVGSGSDRGQTRVGSGSEYEYGATQAADTTRLTISGRVALGFCVLVALTAAAWLWLDRRADEPRTVFPRQLTVSAGVDLFPALSPDGTRLAYSSNRTGAWEIYIRPTNGSGADVPLTSDGQQNVQAAWSPDGRQIAFHSMVRGGIWIMPADGGRARQVSDFGTRPAWSPDGLRLAFQTDAAADIGPAARAANLPSTIWIVHAAGGQPRPLTRRGVPVGGHGAPTWSPDGRYIAFVTAGFALSQIWAVDATGGDPFRISTDGVIAFDPVYLPDGRALVFASHHMLWHVPLDANGRATGRPTRYVPAALEAVRHLTISRDGQIALAALSLDASLWSIPVTPQGEVTGEARPLTDDTRQRNSKPAFSPDGRRIAVMSSVTGSPPGIWTMSTDGSGLQRLTDEASFDADPSWTPDGREVIFKSIRNRRAGLWTVDANTRRQRLLTDFGAIEELARQQGMVEEAAVSPDATRIASTVLDPRTSTKALYVRGVSGGQPMRLTSGEPLVGFPAWSPDGRWIALEVFEAGRTDAAVVSADGGPLRRLTWVRGQSWVHSFSPDSQRIVFAGQRDGVWNIYWVPRDGGEERRVTNNTRVGEFLRYPSWSPRGDQIVFERGAVRGNIWTVAIP